MKTYGTPIKTYRRPIKTYGKPIDTYRNHGVQAKAAVQAREAAALAAQIEQSQETNDDDSLSHSQTIIKAYSAWRFYRCYMFLYVLYMFL